MIEGTGECYSQSASHARSFIKDLLSPSAEDGLGPYSLWAIAVKNEDLAPIFIAASIPLDHAIEADPENENPENRCNQQMVTAEFFHGQRRKNVL